jgi:membrane fusion protein, copper/silver efflux system
MTIRLRFLLAVALATAVAGAIAGFEWGRRPRPSAAAPAAAGTTQRRVLYWYDPMEPGQHFDKPGKSPFMDMQMVPRYADDEGGTSSGVRVDPRLAQNLGIRTATVERSKVAPVLIVPGTVVFNERLRASVQARAAGFVARIYDRAPGDVVARHAPLADVLVPDWASAQIEFLSVLGSGDAALVSAARQRLALLGMSPTLIAQTEQSRRVVSEITIAAPIAGAIDTLELRAGMTISPGATLATIRGLDPIWVEAAVPEAVGATAIPGAAASITVSAYPGEPVQGRVVSVLPQTNIDSHTLRVRLELANPRGQLKPGMYAQVQLTAGERHWELLIPSEAVIRTGTRDLVIVESAPNRFEPVAVRTGAEYGARTSVLAGLREGQKVVASGQFLIDSEANLRGVTARMGTGATP